MLKCNHDCGSIVICKDKSAFDFENAKALLTKGLNTNYYLLSREWPYKGVERKIIAEEYLENNAREGLHDYKVWCFNGQAKYVQYISGRMGGETREGFFDEEWNLQRFTYHNPKIQTSVPKPQCLAELFELANRLAEGMPFARIDFYVLQNNQIKFGEITFYPMGGIGKWHPEEMDKELGDLIDLSLVSDTGN